MFDLYPKPKFTALQFKHRFWKTFEGMNESREKRTIASLMQIGLVFLPENVYAIQERRYTNLDDGLPPANTLSYLKARLDEGMSVRKIYEDMLDKGLLDKKSGGTYTLNTVDQWSQFKTAGKVMRPNMGHLPAALKDYIRKGVDKGKTVKTIHKELQTNNHITRLCGGPVGFLTVREQARTYRRNTGRNTVKWYMVLELVEKGLTEEQIRSKLNISENAYRAHLNRLIASGKLKGIRK